MICLITRLAILVCLVAPVLNSKLLAQSIDLRIHNFLSEKVQQDGIPGLTISVVQDGETVYMEAFGVREQGKDQPLTPEHIFHFASVSKLFVATSIVRLVEKGKIDLDESVTSYLPYFKLNDPRYQDITIKQMLNHTSGMPDVRNYQWDKPQYDDGAAERFVRQMSSESLLWAPGTNWRYSNLAFDALGDVISKVSGISFEAYVKKNILEPLGMDKSSFIYPEIPEELRTTGHVGKQASPSKVYPYNRRHAPSSTLNTSVSQMTKWMQANLNGGRLNGQQILNAESYQLLWEPTTDVGNDQVHIGLSWFIRDFQGRKTVSHSGGDRGFRSFLLLLPDDNIGIVLASNWEETDPGPMVQGIMEMLLSEE